MSESPQMEIGQPAATVRQSRRLFDKILVVFHHACDQQELEVAGRLLDLLEMMVVRRGAENDPMRRRNMDSLVAAHERLWNLKHPAPPR